MYRVLGFTLISCLVLTVAVAAPSPQPAPSQRLLGRPYLAPAQGPASAAIAPLQSVPYDAAVKSKEVRPLPCSSAGQGYGSYQPVTAQDEKNGISNDLAPLAWQTFTQNQSITGCKANSAQPVSYNLTQACKQVVAGTNYAFQFQAYFDCTTQQGSGSFGSVTLDAIVFKPLENVKQNIIPPQVTSVWNVTQA